MADYLLARESKVREVVEGYRPFLEYAAIFNANGLDCQKPGDKPLIPRLFKTNLTTKI